MCTLGPPNFSTCTLSSLSLSLYFVHHSKALSCVHIFVLNKTLKIAVWNYLTSSVLLINSLCLQYSLMNKMVPDFFSLHFLLEFVYILCGVLSCTLLLIKKLHLLSLIELTKMGLKMTSNNTKGLMWLKHRSKISFFIDDDDDDQSSYDSLSKVDVQNWIYNESTCWIGISQD